MNKLLLGLALLVVFLSLSTDALGSLHTSIGVKSSGTIEYLTTATNLAGKRSDWQTAPNGFSYYITWESDTVMRLDSRPDGGPYYPYCREDFLSQRYSVSVGDHIYAKVHIKADPWSGTWSGDAGGGNGGGRIIVDHWIKGKIMDETNPAWVIAASGMMAPANAHYVNFGTEVDVVLDYVIPHINQTDQIDQVILDIQVRPEYTGASNVTFSNMEFYINP